MRPALALRQTGAAFREIVAREAPGGFAAIKALSPTGLLPVLQHGTELIWDSLAIGEYLAEEFPDAGLWPHEKAARAHARSMVAEMHSGFAALREHLPMNIQAHYPAFHKNAAVRREIARVSVMWQQCLARFGGNGPFLFGSFTLADAFFAPVVMRFTSYDVELSPPLAAYVEAVRVQQYVKEWVILAHADRHLNPAYAFAR
jgi:glutathione S-transferase